MPADRAAAIRCLVAFAVLCGGFLLALDGASHDLRHGVVIVRATPHLPAPALASIEVTR